MTEAAAIDRLSASPLIIASQSAAPAAGRSGRICPSTSTASIGPGKDGASAAIAAFIAPKVAGKSPSASISAALLLATAKRCGWAAKAVSISARIRADNFLESVSRGGSAARCSGEIQKAAAVTGPAQGPRPASSTPITTDPSGQRDSS